MNHIVVIAGTPGVARNPALPRPRWFWLDRVIRQAKHHDAAHAVENVPRMVVGVLPRGEILHLTRESAIEPLGQARDTGRGDCRTDADEREAKAEGLGFDSVGQSAPNERLAGFA